MSRDPYSWADQFAGTGENQLSQSRAQAANMLLSLFSEEAARQRPYVSMPANLAEAQFNRQNAEPFQIRAEQRRYAQNKALIGARAAAKNGGVDTGATTDDQGNDVITIDGVTYSVPKAS
jgi:hypothetical protein